MTDPSQPQNYLGGPPWMSTADLAAVGFHAQNENQSQPAPPPPDPRAERRKRRARRIRAVAFTIAAIAFAVGGIVDYAHGGHPNPAGSVVMAVIFGFFAVHQWLRAHQTKVTTDAGSPVPFVPGN